MSRQMQRYQHVVQRIESCATSSNASPTTAAVPLTSSSTGNTNSILSLSSSSSTSTSPSLSAVSTSLSALVVSSARVSRDLHLPATSAPRVIIGDACGSGASIETVFVQFGVPDDERIISRRAPASKQHSCPLIDDDHDGCGTAFSMGGRSNRPKSAKYSNLPSISSSRGIHSRVIVPMEDTIGAERSGGYTKEPKKVNFCEVCTKKFYQTLEEHRLDETHISAERTSVANARSGVGADIALSNGYRDVYLPDMRQMRILFESVPAVTVRSDSSETNEPQPQELERVRRTTIAAAACQPVVPSDVRACAPFCSDYHPRHPLFVRSVNEPPSPPVSPPTDGCSILTVLAFVMVHFSEEIMVDCKQRCDEEMQGEHIA